MCLLSKSKKPLIAKEDIHCYKEIKLIYKKNELLHFLTPYQNLDITKSITETKEITPTLKSRIYRFFHFPQRLFNGYVISEGYIHAYRSILGFRIVPSIGNIIIDCIIPKGTKYYIGNHNDYAAEKLEIINSDEEISVFIGQLHYIPIE